MKAVKNFLIRIRTACDKDIKKYPHSITPSLQDTLDFLRDLLVFIEKTLYLDKPVEGALPYFELLKMIFELFGDFEYKLRIT